MVRIVPSALEEGERLDDLPRAEPLDDDDHLSGSGEEESDGGGDVHLPEEGVAYLVSVEDDDEEGDLADKALQLSKDALGKVKAMLGEGYSHNFEAQHVENAYNRLKKVLKAAEDDAWDEAGRQCAASSSCLSRALHSEKLFAGKEASGEEKEESSASHLVHMVSVLGIIVEKLAAFTAAEKKEDQISILEQRQRDRERTRREERKKKPAKDIKQRLIQHVTTAKVKWKHLKSFVSDPLGWKEYRKAAAAKKIQALVRGHLSRARRTRRHVVLVQTVVRRIQARRRVYEKMFRETSKLFEENSAKYYFSSPAFKPAKVSWDPPRMLKNTHIPFGIRVRPKGYEWGAKEAAIAIQSLQRCRASRVRFKAKIYETWQKVYEPGKDAWFYENINTKKCQWTKPRALNKYEDIPFPGE